MTKKEIWFKGTGNYKLYGVLTLPKGIKNPPLVIMCHGFGWGASESTSYKPLVKPLIDNGIASLYYDRMGVGKSGGKFAETKHSTDLLDLNIIINSLLSKFDFNPRKIALFGASAGGFLSILHAAKDSRIKYLCLKAPAINYRLFWQKRKGFNNWKKSNMLKYLIKQTGEYKSLKYTFFQDLIKLDVYKTAPNISIPISIIYAENDKRIPTRYSKIFLDKVTSEDKELIPIKGTNPWFAGHKQEVNRAIIHWLVSKLT